MAIVRKSSQNTINSSQASTRYLVRVSFSLNEIDCYMISVWISYQWWNIQERQLRLLHCGNNKIPCYSKHDLRPVNWLIAWYWIKKGVAVATTKLKIHPTTTTKMLLNIFSKRNTENVSIWWRHHEMQPRIWYDTAPDSSPFVMGFSMVST